MSETTTHPDATPKLPMAEPLDALRLRVVLDAAEQFAVSTQATTHAVVAERMFDAMCCGARAADLPFIGQGTDHALALALIDLLFSKLADTREADAADDWAEETD